MSHYTTLLCPTPTCSGTIAYMKGDYLLPYGSQRKVRLTSGTILPCILDGTLREIQPRRELHQRR